MVSSLDSPLHSTIEHTSAVEQNNGLMHNIFVLLVLYLCNSTRSVSHNSDKFWAFVVTGVQDGLVTWCYLFFPACTFDGVQDKLLRLLLVSICHPSWIISCLLREINLLVQLCQAKGNSTCKTQMAIGSRDVASKLLLLLVLVQVWQSPKQSKAKSTCKTEIRETWQSAAEMHHV